MYTVADTSVVPSEAAMTCVPPVSGAVYKPAAVIVPIDGDPPVTLSTDHATGPAGVPPRLNCCACPVVMAVVRGAMNRPDPTPVSVTRCGFPAALSEIT